MTDASGMRTDGTISGAAAIAAQLSNDRTHRHARSLLAQGIEVSEGSQALPPTEVLAEGLLEDVAPFASGHLADQLSMHLVRKDHVDAPTHTHTEAHRDRSFKMTTCGT